MFSTQTTALCRYVVLSMKILVAFVALSLFGANNAFARVDVCYAGGQFLPNFTLNGNGFLNGTDILVTQASGNQRTSVMYDTPLSTSGDIHIRFVVRISQSGNGGADGMAFVMHNASTGTAALGAAGGGIGYDGISPAVVVEFDTYLNGWDANANHVAITRGLADHGNALNSGLPGAVTNPPVTLKSGSNIYVWIDYIGSTHTLSVFLDSTSTKPGSATLSTTAVNVATALGSQMYIGFTGSTGGSWNQHEIVELYATDTGTPGDACCATNADCSGKTAPLGTVCDPVKKVCGPCSLVEDGSCPQPAGCNVSAALNTCTLECAGDFGSGSSNACTAANFKACSVAGSTAGNCVMCNGDYSSGSGYSVRCPSGAPTCLDDGFCGTCKVNADCTTGYGHAGTVCNTSTGQCGCTSSSDCSAATSAGPVCSGGICGCSTDAQCGTGKFCSNAVCKDKLTNGTAIPNDTLHAATCNSTNATAVCQSAQCNATTKTCAGPNTTTDCTAANQCVSNVCGANFKCGIVDFSGPCSSGTVCQSATCSNGGNVCIATNSCWVDADCAADKHCDRTSRGCVADLVSGTAIPNDGYHLASCSDAAAVCASHACNSNQKTCGEANGVACALSKECVVDICGSNGHCGIADYDGTCNGSNAATLCQSAACSVGAVCMASTACYVDADCSSSQYCNRTSHVCTTKLNAGGDIPSDTLHDGTCSVASAVCASGLGCNSVQTTCGAVNGTTCTIVDECIANICGANSKCGYADGTGSCNSGNAAALCQSGTCSASVGICIPSVNGCGSDDDCGLSNYCSGTTFTCIPRLSAGTALPNDGIHNGSCSIASRVCESGLACNSTEKTCGKVLSQPCDDKAQCEVDICGSNGKCGLANQQGSCSVSSAATLCQSGFCGSSSSVCINGASGCGVDSDCDSGQFCNGATMQCSAKLANGVPIPNDGLHDGNCGVSLTSVVCASGQCNTETDTCAGPNGTDCGNAAECVVDRCGANSKCGIADGQSGCTVSDGAVLCQSADCAPSGTCVPPDGCYIDSDCGSEQFCDRSNLACHAKLSKGENIPDDGLHLGVCDVPTAAAVCQSGKCNDVTMTCAEVNGVDCGDANQCVVNICGANAKCGIANGSSGCTPLTGVTLCQSATCPSSGVCIPTNTFCWIDTDCAPEQFCKRNTNMCVSDLGAGIALPSDGLHDGNCSAELALSVCLSGLCNATTDSCAGGKNAPCTNNAQCELDICGSNGLCGLANGEGPCSQTTKGTCQSGQCGGNSNRCVPSQTGCNVDSDCSAGYFCNPSAMTCLSRLSDGTPLPKDAIHDGKCTVGLATIACVSGRCNSVANTCGAINGGACATATQCQSNVCGNNGQCGRTNGESGCTLGGQILDCQSAHCSTSGVCIPALGCGVSSECDANQYCDLVTLTCVPKLVVGALIPKGGCTSLSADEFCGSGNCNSTTNTCAVENGNPCQTAADCVTGICGGNALCGLPIGNGPCTVNDATICQSGLCGQSSNACIPTMNGCNQDADCETGMFCEVTTRTCVALQKSGAKLPVDEQHDGKCTTQLATAVCESGVCNPSANTCAEKNTVECTKNSDCVSNVCGSNGLCGLAVGENGCTETNQGQSCQTGECSGAGTCVPKGGCAISADCTLGSYCDTTTNSCVPKVESGEKIPTEKSQCSAANAKEICASGECNSETNTCAEKTGASCKKNQECVSNACGSNNRCQVTACTTEFCSESSSGFVGGGGCSIDRDSRNPKVLLILLGLVLLGQRRSIRRRSTLRRWLE
jgi:Legume lectin domain